MTHFKREEVVDGDLFVDEEGRTFIAEWKKSTSGAVLIFKCPGGPIYTASDYAYAIKSIGLRRKKK